jgi:hypothetical protein
MKTTFVILFSLVWIGFACEKDKSNLKPKTPIIGSWVEEKYEDSVKVLSQHQNLQENRYGFTFLQSGKFVERKNSGPCATPPIVYKNFDGKWERDNDSLIHIQVGYWGGKMEYDMEIVFMSSDTLKIVYDYKH